MRLLAFILAALLCAVPAFAQYGPGTAPAAATVPPDTASSAPSMFADFANRTYAAAIGGQLYLQPMDGVAVGSGTAAGFFVDPIGIGHNASPYSLRLTVDPASTAKAGAFVEPAVSNIITTAATFTSDGATTFSAGADGQASVAIPPAQCPQLLPGYAVAVTLRDATTNGGTPNFTVTLPASIHSFTMQAWVCIPSTALPQYTTYVAPSQINNLCLSSGGTGVSNSKACVNLDKKGVWQLVKAGFATSTATSALIALQLNGPPGAVAYSTGWAVTPLTYAGSVPPVAGRTSETLVASGVGLEALGGASGTLLFKGFAADASSVAATASGGLQAFDSTGANSISLQVFGDPVQPVLRASSVVNGAAVAAITGGAMRPGRHFTMALSWGPAGYVYADSLGGVGAAAGALPVKLARLAALTGPINQTRWAFYPTQMTAAALQNLVGAGLAVTASAAVASPGLTVPSNFIGLSFEATGAVGNHQFAVAGAGGASGNSMKKLMNLLGGGMLRLGGGTSDETGFTINAAQATELGTFMPLVPNWKMIFGLNLCQANASAQAAAGALVAAAVPSVTLQFGNEPDLYTPTSCTPKAPAINTYGPTAYLADWASYLTAVRAVAPTVALAGPDVGQTDSWLSPFLAAQSANVTFATRHFYPFCSGVNATAPNLLMSDDIYPASTLAADVALATTYGLKLRLTETNSICAGGQTGISNTLISAAWATEYMMQGIAAGLSGVNFHGDSTLPSSNTYSPITQATDLTWTFNPLGYALLTIAQIEGMRLLPVTSSVPFTTMPVQAYLDGAGKIWFLAVNKNLTQPAQLTLNQPGVTQASVMLLTGASSTALTATLGGASVDNAGNWTPALSSQAATAPINIPPASAALIKLQ
jgi:hypothetical protein